MNDVKRDNKRNENDTPEDSGVDAEMQEFKREMQTAKAADWAQRNQQKLIALAVLIVASLLGSSLWLENTKSQSHAAATLYHQALATNDDMGKQALLETVIEDYSGSGYSSLAHLQLAKGGDIEIHLNALMNDSDVPQELAWQARLDLAEIALNKGDVDTVNVLLSETTGQQFEQLRFYFLAQASATDAQKQAYFQKALDAISNDVELKNKIESLLSMLSDTVGVSS